MRAIEKQLDGLREWLGAAQDNVFHFVLGDEIVTKERQTGLDKLGIAKTAREEKIRERDLKLKMQQQAEHERMTALYRKHVLKEPDSGLVRINGIAPAAPVKERQEETAGALGD